MSAPIVVQARDGRWLFGREDQEAALRATPKGSYDTAADASDAATRLSSGGLMPDQRCPGCGSRDSFFGLPCPRCNGQYQHDQAAARRGP